MWRFAAIILALHVLTVSAQCAVDIPLEGRRECYPWVNATFTDCEARGCIYCPSEEADIPDCFYDDGVCPSQIVPLLRTDCMPEGGDRNSCLIKGCLWCEPQNPDVPPCFEDPEASLGGPLCPADIPEDERIDCYPDNNGTVSETICLARGCFFCDDSTSGAPVCFATKQYGYRMVGPPEATPQGQRVTLRRVNTPSWFGADIQTIVLDVEYQLNGRLRLKLYDPLTTRYEVPMAIDAPASIAPNPLYDVTFTNDPAFALKVTRISTGTVVLDTSMGGLTFADQFIQLSTRLNSTAFYGLGEHEHRTFKHHMKWETWSMWARDQLVKDSNLYGVQPIYYNVEQTGDTHGVFFMNSNAQAVTLMPTPGLTYRTIGGVLDMYMFFGPSPNAVTQQLTEAIGRPLMPPYWALGFHLCRWGYNNLDNLKAAVGRMRQNDIPHDVQYGDIDYMDGRKDFTIDLANFAGLPEYVDELKQQGTRYIIILDPAISDEEAPGTYPPFDRGNEDNVWVMNGDGSAPEQGRVWPGTTLYADFTNPDTATWWLRECLEFKQRLDYDGLWIDMNEPSNFIHGTEGGCENTNLNYPLYDAHVAGDLSMKTMCAEINQYIGIGYNVHSLYGWSMAQQTLPAARNATGTRSFVITRSTFPGSGKFAHHWLGDNSADWPRLRHSLIGMMEFNMFGIPFVGVDICGFTGAAEEHMCRRWQQVGAFYTFSRNHNAQAYPDQDPGMWPLTVAVDARATLLTRYRLLPYLYTLHHNAHSQGSTVIRSLMMEFPADAETYTIQDQFLWGSAFMVSPVLDENATTVNAYFPNARWFDYYSGQELSVRGDYVTLDAPIDTINLHLRGGAVLPTQEPANATVFSRQNPMGVIVALDDTASASGQLFWDDGESLDTFENGQYFEIVYTVAENTLTGTVVASGVTVGLNLDEVVVMGTSQTVTSVTVNGVGHLDWTQDPVTMQLTVSNAAAPIDAGVTVTWS